MLKLRNISSNYLKVAVDGLIVVLLTPYVVGELGVAQYAVWIIVQTIGYYLGFLDLGIGDAQVHRHSVLQAQGATQELGRLHGTVLTFMMGAGLLAVVLAAGVGALPLADVLDVPADSREEYPVVLLLVGLATLTTFIEAAFAGLYEGYQRYDLMNAIDIVIAVLEAFALAGSLYLGFGLTGLAAVVVLGSAAAIAVKAAVARRSFPQHAWPRLGFDPESWRSIRGFTAWNSLTDLVTEGTANLDKLLIPILLASALVTPYSFVVMIAALVFLAAEPITETFFPLVARRHGSRDRVSLGVLLTRGSRLVQVATLPVAVVLLCFGQAVLVLWIGTEVDAAAPPVLWFTVMSFYFSTYLWTSLSVLMGSGEARFVFWSSAIEVVATLVLLLVLAPTLGLTGFALAGLVTNVGFGLGLLVPRACRLAGEPVGATLLRTFVVPTAGALPGLGVGVWLAAAMRPDTWLEAGLGIALTGSLTAVGVLGVGVSRWERARYRTVLRRFVRFGDLHAAD